MMHNATPDSNRDHHEVSASCMPVCTMDTVQGTSLAERTPVTEVCELIHSWHKLCPAITHSSPCTDVDIHNVKTVFLSETVGQISCLHLRNNLKINLSWKCEARPHYLQFHQSHMQPGPPEPALCFPGWAKPSPTSKNTPFQILRSQHLSSVTLLPGQVMEERACDIINPVSGIVA